jgi:Electron transfer flavoprotein, alpha subunit
MAGAFWCVVEDDRQGNPKKVMAEVLGEAARLAAQAGGQVEAVWLTDKATEAGIKQLGEWGAKRILLAENAAFAPYRGEVWAPVLAELVQKESPQAVFGAVTTRQREVMARLARGWGRGSPRTRWPSPSRTAS